MHFGRCVWLLGQSYTIRSLFGVHCGLGRHHYWQMLMHSPIDLAKVLSFERRLQRILLGVLCLKIAGSDEIRSRVSFLVWLFGFRGRAAKLCCMLPSWTCLLHFMMMSETENIIEAEI
jgi:hypothetical protein